MDRPRGDLPLAELGPASVTYAVSPDLFGRHTTIRVIPESLDNGALNGYAFPGEDPGRLGSRTQKGRRIKVSPKNG